MKKDARKKLVKDLLILMCGVAIVAIAAIGVGEDSDMAMLFGVAVGGFPFGWRWLSKIFISLSPFMLLVKFVLSAFLGWIACPVVFIKDIVDLFKAKQVDDALNTSYQNINNVVPQAYKCPNCEGQVAYGESKCGNCGTAFKW